MEVPWFYILQKTFVLVVFLFLFQQSLVYHQGNEIVGKLY